MWAPLFAVETLLLTENATCPAFQCASTANVTFDSSTCVFYNSSTYYTAACTDHYSTFCAPIQGADMNNVTNSTCILPPPEGILLSWPGETCINDTYCTGGPCMNGICYGDSYSQTCQDTYQCNPGLTCSSGVCSMTLPPFQFGCSDDYDCQNNAGCNSTQCLPYFSVPAGDVVETCDNGMNFLCESLTCASTGKTFICTGLLQSTKPSTDEAPTECNLGDQMQCSSVLDSALHLHVPGRCLCSFSPAGKAYCGAFPGDPVGQLYMDYLHKWVNSSAILQCNPQRRFEAGCMATHWTTELFNNYTYAEMKYLYYPVMITMDNCTKRVYLQEYFQAYNRVFGQEESAAGWLALSVALGVVISG